MPVFEIEHPDGRTFEVDAPDIAAATAAIGQVPHGKPISQMRALGEGIQSGITAGFSDEIAGLQAASGASDSFFDPRAISPALVGAARVGYEKLTGQEGEATKAYRTTRDERRERQKAAEEQFPKTYIGGEVLGGVAVPVPAAKGATLAGRALKAAKTGGAYGAVTGVGQGEDLGDSAVRAAVGGIGGTILGGVAAPVAEGVGRVISKVAAPAINTVRSVFSPRDEAARQVVTAIERDIKADPQAATRLTPAEFVAARAEGQPVAVADVGGGLTRRLADVAAITSPEGATALRSTIDPRFESQSPRLAAWLRQTFHYPDAAAQQDAIASAASTVNKATYNRAYRDPAARGIWDPTFEQISQAPEVQAAIRKVLPQSGSQAAREGFTPVRNPFQFDSQTGRMTLRTQADGSVARPDLQFWDQVKRALDKGDWSSREWSRILRGELDKIVPSYQQARAGAAHFFGAENALEAGQNFVGAAQRYGIPEARKALSQMSQQERQLFQDGYVSRLVEQIEKNPDRRSVLNQIQQSPAARTEIRMAIGQDRANELESRLRVEGIMDLVRNAVSGNSWTARRLYDVGLAGGAGLGLEGGVHSDPKDIAIGAIVAALSSGGKRVNTNVMRHVAELLASSDIGQLAKGVNIVARNPRLLDALRATDRRLASIAGEQSSNLPAVQAGGVSPAQSNQNQVPRPPAQ